MKLEGVKSNRSAIGARVLAHYGGKTQAQSVLSQCSFYSCNDPRLHFGLGDFTSVDLEVHWPNGLTESFKRVPINQLVTIREGVRPGPQSRLVQDLSEQPAGMRFLANLPSRKTLEKA